MNVVKEILTYFPVGGINYNILDHGNNRGSLVITIKGQVEDQSIAFVGHIDTVPVPDEEEWLYPPFDAVMVKDVVYGRGSADMKGGVTAMIITALYLLENDITPKYTTKFIFTADEESGGMGIVAVREAGYLNDAIRLIVPEPTNNQIGLCEKGALWLHVEASGQAAHGSRPELGANAIEQLFKFIDKLTPAVMSNEEHPLLGKASIEMTQIKGGIKTNIIPDFAEMTLDIRTIPGQNHAFIVQKAEDIVRELMDHNERVSIKVRIDNDRPPVMTEESAPIVKEIQEVYEQFHITPTVKGIYFYTDASQIIPFIDIPFVIMGPGEEEMAHQKDERIALSMIEEMTNMYIRYIEQL